MAATLAGEVSPRKLELLGVTEIRDLLFEKGKGRRPTQAELAENPELTPDTLLPLSVARVGKLSREHPDFPPPDVKGRRGWQWRRGPIERFAERWDQKPGPRVRRRDGA